MTIQDHLFFCIFVRPFCVTFNKDLQASYSFIIKSGLIKTDKTRRSARTLHVHQDSVTDATYVWAYRRRGLQEHSGENH